MNGREFLDILHVAERLKDTLRHSTTTSGRAESVAEHSWRTALMALLLAPEFPAVDMDRVIRMCLIHDLGEAFTGDIPVFNKTEADEARERDALFAWVASLPAPIAAEMQALYGEMLAQESPEARIYKALDGMEAVAAHNEADISGWAPNEYALNRVYAAERCSPFPPLAALRAALREETERKIENSVKCEE